MNRILFILALILGCTSLKVNATHISGGDFTVQHLSDSTFEVTLTIFRDINGSNLQGAVSVSVYEEGTNTPLGDLDYMMPLDSSYFLDLGDECFDSGLMLEIGIYSQTITLPDNPNGYYFVWERCCRNALAINIVPTFVTEGPGMVFLVTIPDPALQNSSPIFTPYPTDGYLCVNGINELDFSATDADGDSLVYRLETPLAGETTQANVDPGGGGPKPHDPVVWVAPYDLSNVCGGDPPMSIDSETGILTAQPDIQGLFVLAVEVDEYRDGILIGTIRREIQLQSIICALPVPPQYVNYSDGDTIQVYPIVDNVANIVVEATGSNINASVQGEIITPGFDPLAYIDTLGSGDNEITLQLQWDSIPCDMIGEVYLLEFYAEAFSDCLDTILTNTLNLYVEVIVDPDVATNYVSPFVDSYDIIYGQSDTYEFPVTVVDGNPTDTLTLSMITDISGTNPVIFNGDTANSLATSDFSWLITCDDIQDEPYQVTFQTITTYCEVQDTTLFQMNLNVMLPTDDSTVYVTPEGDFKYWYLDGEEKCFDVGAVDGNNIDTLILSVDRSSPIFEFSNAATFEDTQSTLFVESEFCWTPQCIDIEPGTYPVDFTVITKNCDIIQITERTIDLILAPETDGTLDTIPNVFTPNGDMFNEQFEIKYTPDFCVTDYLIEIYNRWGDVVFTSQDRDEHWDGKINGNDAAEGTYYLIVNYKYFDTPKKETGTIQLLR